MDEKILETVKNVYSKSLIGVDKKRYDIIIDALCEYYTNKSKECGYSSVLLCIFDDELLDDVK